MKDLRPKKLKTLPQYFEEVTKGNKKAELRFNDRGFKVGDIYELEEFDGKMYTGRSVTVRITHILEGFEGLQEGWCMFSFERIEENENAKERFSNDDLYDIDAELYKKAQAEKTNEHAKVDSFYRGYEKGCDDFRNKIKNLMLKEANK